MRRWALVIGLAGTAQYATVMWVNREKAETSARALDLWSQQMETSPFVRHPMPTDVAESTKKRADFQPWVLGATVVFILSQLVSLSMNLADRRSSARWP